MSDIKGYLPDLYKASRYISAICDINNAEFDRLYDGLADFENDMFIDTADEDGVNRFEKCFGLVLQNDTLMERKSRIKAKMRGYTADNKGEFTGDNRKLRRERRYCRGYRKLQLYGAVSSAECSGRHD